MLHYGAYFKVNNISNILILFMRFISASLVVDAVIGENRLILSLFDLSVECPSANHANLMIALKGEIPINGLCSCNLTHPRVQVFGHMIFRLHSTSLSCWCSLYNLGIP